MCLLPFSCSSCWISWQKTSSSPTWVWLCSPSSHTSSTLCSLSEPLYPSLKAFLEDWLEIFILHSYTKSILQSSSWCFRQPENNRASRHIQSQIRWDRISQLAVIVLLPSWPTLLHFKLSCVLDLPVLPSWPCFWAERRTFTLCLSCSTWAAGTRSDPTFSMWWCLQVGTHYEYEQFLWLRFTWISPHLHLIFFFPRSAWRDDVCSFNPGHSDLRPPDDVFYHPPNCLLHCLDLWRWHHAHAVLHEYTVRLDSDCLQLDLSSLSNFSVHFTVGTLFLSGLVWTLIKTPL